MSNRVLMIATTAAMIEQFNKSNIDVLNSMGYVVDVIGNFEKGNPISEERLEDFKKWIVERKGKWYHIPAARSPLAVFQNGKAVRITKTLLRKNKYAFIHCHTPIGSVIGRMAAHSCKTKVVYTAHGFHFYRKAPLQNWILYYPIEKWFSKYTDVLITINKEDYSLAKHKMHARRTIYIPGIGINAYPEMAEYNIIQALKEELHIPQNAIVFLSVGELNHNKNHQFVIEAIEDIPQIYYVICGKGELLGELKEKAIQLGISDRVIFAGFRNDINTFYQMADVFIFPSFREGLSVSLMEAMAFGLPAICSRIRGNVDLINENKGGLLFDPKDNIELKSKIQYLIDNNEKMKSFGLYNKDEAIKYDVNYIKRKMKRVYSSLTDR